MKSLSLAAYARHRGVSCEAVRKAIRTGRLVRSVQTVDGQPKIASVEIADAEWTERTRERAADDSSDYHEARARRETALARLAELELAEREGALVGVAEVRQVVADKYTRVRTRLLAVPTRAKAQRPNLSVDDVRAIDFLIREALEELADENG